MFEHSEFAVVEFEEVPLDRDIYLVSDSLMGEFEREMVSLFSGQGCDWTGPVTCVAARFVDKYYIELSWYTNVFDRFHELRINLPREHFVSCITCPRWDQKPCVFVKEEWIENLHQKNFSVFAMLDAIGVKNALAQGTFDRTNLSRLRAEIDLIAEKFPSISFVSFADSLLLKSNWLSGHYKKGIVCNYAPELFFEVIEQVQEAYFSCLGLKIYAVLTQGSNEYYDDALLHISKSQNHISLNSLGLPFVQLMRIEEAVRKSIRCKLHDPADLYMDDCFYHSLRFKYGFEKWKLPNFEYSAPMSATACTYFCASLDVVSANLELDDRDQSLQQK